jgi:hypothetical protein
LKNDLAGLTIFGVKEIDLDRGVGLCKCIKGQEKKNDDEEESKKPCHSGLLWPRHTLKNLLELLAMLICGNINCNHHFCRGIGP